MKKKNFEQLRLDLCQNKPDAKKIIQSYFLDYVRSSRTLRPVLGEQESECVQTITTIKAVMKHWESLVAEAVNTILREQRRRDPPNKALWKLRWDPGDSKDRPVADISRVSNIPRQSHLS
jgi:hypothetical protein